MTIEKANGIVNTGSEVSKQVTGASDVNAERNTVATVSGTISKGIDSGSVGPVIITDYPAVSLVAMLVAVLLDMADSAISLVVGLFD